VARGARDLHALAGFGRGEEADRHGETAAGMWLRAERSVIGGGDRATIEETM
jgi:hypothetical protein